MITALTNVGALYFAGRTMVRRSKLTAETPIDDLSISDAIVEGVTTTAIATCTVLGILALTPMSGAFGLILMANDTYEHRTQIAAFARKLRPKAQAVRANVVPLRRTKA